MPYKSDAQRRYFNANRKELEAQGVDVDEWNTESKGKKLPKRAKKKAAAVPSLGTDLSFTEGMDIEQIRQELLQRVQLIAQLRAHRDALLDDKARASIKLASSRVHGTGLFTNVNIKKGTKFARAMVKLRGEDAQARYELTKAARYTNHSQDPSAQMVKVGNEIYLVALKAIPAGTEVLVDYRKTASVLGPGSYITFEGKKRTTWNQLEKQAKMPRSWEPGAIRDAKWLNKQQERARISHNTGQYSSGTTNWLDHLLRSIPGSIPPTIESPRGIDLPADVLKEQFRTPTIEELSRQGHTKRNSADPIARAMAAMDKQAGGGPLTDTPPTGQPPLPFDQAADQLKALEGLPDGFRHGKMYNDKVDDLRNTQKPLVNRRATEIRNFRIRAKHGLGAIGLPPILHDAPSLVEEHQRETWKGWERDRIEFAREADRQALWQYGRSPVEAKAHFGWPEPSPEAASESWTPPPEEFLDGKPGASADPIARAIKQAMFLPFHTNKYRDELLGRIEKRQLAAMDKRKKQLIAEGASPEDFAELDYSESPKWQRESAARRKQKAEAEEKEEKKADMLKNLGEGVATGVEGLTGTVRKALELLVEDVEEREKEEEKLEKAIKRNARERKARKIAKTDAWKYAYYNPAVAYGMSTEEIQASTAQLGRMLNSRLKYKPKKKKKRRKKDYAAETELQKLKTREKMMLQDARHQNLMAELRLRQEMANARIKAGSSGPITKALEFAGVDSKVLEFAGIKKKDKDEEKRKEEELAAAQAQNMTPAAKYGALLAKKSFEIMKTANSAAPQASYLQQQANPTQQRSSAHEQMNAQAGGAGPQQPALPPDQQQVLAQRPQARPSSRQRPLNPTAANLGIGPLTGDQFAPGAQSGLGMAVTARAINGQGDLIDRALQSIKQAGGGPLAGGAPVAEAPAEGTPVKVPPAKADPKAFAQFPRLNARGRQLAHLPLPPPIKFDGAAIAKELNRMPMGYPIPHRAHRREMGAARPNEIAVEALEGPAMDITDPRQPRGFWKGTARNPDGTWDFADSVAVKIQRDNTLGRRRPVRAIPNRQLLRKLIPQKFLEDYPDWSPQGVTDQVMGDQEGSWDRTHRSYMRELDPAYDEQLKFNTDHGDHLFEHLLGPLKNQPGMNQKFDRKKEGRANGQGDLIDRALRSIKQADGGFEEQMRPGPPAWRITPKEEQEAKWVEEDLRQRKEDYDADSRAFAKDTPQDNHVGELPDNEDTSHLRDPRRIAAKRRLDTFAQAGGPRLNSVRRIEPPPTGFVETGNMPTPWSAWYERHDSPWSDGLGATSNFQGVTPPRSRYSTRMGLEGSVDILTGEDWKTRDTPQLTMVLPGSGGGRTWRRDRAPWRKERALSSTEAAYQKIFPDLTEVEIDDGGGYLRSDNWLDEDPANWGGKDPFKRREEFPPPPKPLTPQQQQIAKLKQSPLGNIARRIGVGLGGGNPFGRGAGGEQLLEMPTVDPLEPGEMPKEGRANGQGDLIDRALRSIEKRALNLESMDPTARNALLTGGFGAGLGGLMGGGFSLGGLGRTRAKISDAAADKLLSTVPYAVVRKLQQGEELDSSDEFVLNRAGVDIDKIAPKSSYMGNLVGNTVGGALGGGLLGAAVGGGATELGMQVGTPAYIKYKSQQGLGDTIGGWGADIANTLYRKSPRKERFKFTDEISDGAVSAPLDAWNSLKGVFKQGRANGQGDLIDRALRSIEKQALESLDTGALAGGVIGGTAGGVLGFGGAAGATVGGLYGLFSDPGEDEEGSKVHHVDRRLWRALKGALGGGALGVAGAGAGIAGGVLGAVEGGKLGYRAGEEKNAKNRSVDRSVDRARRLHDLNPQPIEASELPASTTYGLMNKTEGADHLRPTKEEENWIRNWLGTGGLMNKEVRRRRSLQDAAAKLKGGQLYSSTPSLGGQIAGYYKNTPGGFQGAIGDAQQKLRERTIPSNPVDVRLAAYPTWTPEDLRRPVDNYFIPNDAKGGLPGTDGQYGGFHDPTEGYTVSGFKRDRHPASPQNVGSVPTWEREGGTLSRNFDAVGGMPIEEDERGNTTYISPSQQVVLEHELSHGAYGGTRSSGSINGKRGPGAGTPADSTARWQGVPPRDAAGNPNEDYVGQTTKRYSPEAQEHYAYASTPTEMDPRLAEIKRSYAASTGRLVNSPEEAERAWKWWQKKIKKDHRNPGGWGNDLFERINSDPVERAAALRRMQEIVKTDPQQGMSQREVVAHAINGQGDLIDRALQSIKMAEPVEEPADFNLGDHLVGVDTTSLPPDQPGSTMPSVIDRKSVALADVLPKGYRAGAQQHAKAWRASNPRVEEGYSQDISDKAIDRKVDVVSLRPQGFKKNYSRGATLPVNQIGGYYDPNLHGGQIVLPENPNPTTLGHELTHGTQQFDPWNIAFPPSYQGDIETALAEASSPTIRENPARYAKYYGSQRESEAYLATIKRDYYEATGKHVTNAQEAQEALKWNRESPSNRRVELRNEGLSRDQILGPDGKMGTDDDRTNPDGSPILNANTQPLSPKAKAAKENWMKHWAEKMPGLVDTGSPNRFGKTASQGDLIDRALQSIKQADRGTPLGPMTLKPPKPSTGTPVLPLPTNLLGHGIAGGIGGAGIGAMINAVTGRSIGRGAVTGGITGAGALSGMGLGANLSRHPAAEFTGGWAGLGGGGYGGYQLAQYLQGAEEEEEEEEEKKAGGGLYPQIPEAIGAIGGGGVGPAAPSAPKALANGGRLANGMLPGGTVDENGNYTPPTPSPVKGLPRKSFLEMMEDRMRSFKRRKAESDFRKALREGKAASANHAGEEELNKLSEDAGYSPKAQAGGKVKGFPKTLPGVPQVPAWGSDKAIRTPKDTSLGPVKAQSQAKKQFPTKDPFKALERDGFKDGDIEMPSYGDVIDNVDSVRQTYDETKFSSASVVDPIARLLAITKTSTSNTPKRRRKGAPRSVTIKKPARTNPDTGEVTPGSSHIKHIARAGKKLS